MATSKYSHQREAIINFLTGRTDHPTADVVYQYLRNDLPTISLGTVYRNLNQMATSGRILRLHVDGKTDHYDACTAPHAHLLCTKCGAVRDIHMNFEDDLIAQAVAVVGKPASLMSKDEKVQAIQFLNNTGAFLITKSGDKVSHYFGISKYTLYSYIKADKN